MSPVWLYKSLTFCRSSWTAQTSDANRHPKSIASSILLSRFADDRSYLSQTSINKDVNCQLIIKRWERKTTESLKTCRNRQQLNSLVYSMTQQIGRASC